MTSALVLTKKCIQPTIDADCLPLLGWLTMAANAPLSLQELDRSQTAF